MYLILKLSCHKSVAKIRPNNMYKALHLRTQNIVSGQEMIATLDIIITTYFVVGRVLGLQAAERDSAHVMQKGKVHLELPESRS